jgi:hypothetical protein
MLGSVEVMRKRLKGKTSAACPDPHRERLAARRERLEDRLEARQDRLEMRLQRRASRRDREFGP